VTDLKKRGTAFRSLTEQMDTTTPLGEFLFHIFASLAQFERSLRAEAASSRYREAIFSPCPLNFWRS
jgi:DNA invertase Pin-like site-specific DNA recombinase